MTATATTTPETLYHAHGIGQNALAGLLAAAERLGYARKRLLRQPPPPMPRIEPPTLPSVASFGDTEAAHLSAEYSDWSVCVRYGRESYTKANALILRNVSPAALLTLTQNYETLAGDYENAATAHENAVATAVAKAVQDADPIIQELAKRIAVQKADDENKTLGLTVLRAWALGGRGSETLKHRIAGNYSWQSLAETEWAAIVFDALPSGKWPDAEAPEGYDSNASVSDAKEPPLRHMLARQQVLAACHPAVNCELIFCKYSPEREDDDYNGDEEEPAIFRIEIRVNVTCPTGNIETRDYLLPTS